MAPMRKAHLSDVTKHHTIPRLPLLSLKNKVKEIWSWKAMEEMKLERFSLSLS